MNWQVYSFENFEKTVRTIMNIDKKFCKQPSIVAGFSILLLAALAAATAATTESGPESKTNAMIEADKSEQITLRVVAPDGKAVGGTEVYTHFYVGYSQAPVSFKCDKQGKVALGTDDIFKHGRSRVSLYAISGSKLAGFLEVSLDDVGKELELQLEPVCRVYGQMGSSSLEKLGQSLEWTVVYFFRGRHQPLSCLDKTGKFEFLVPAGRYELHAYAARTYTVTREIEITAGQQELEVDFDLPADKLATLIGKPAPELRGIKGWIIKSWLDRIKSWRGIKLSELRGKVVLLDFWGYWCGPCVQGMPELMELYDKYHKDGLEIIAIHDDSVGSIQKLKKNLVDIRRKHWDGRDIPFAVALDGGGSTKIEGTDLSTSGATTAAYGIQGWPTMVLIDKDGTVVKEFYKTAENIELLERMLRE